MLTLAHTRAAGRPPRGEAPCMSGIYGKRFKALRQQGGYGLRLRAADFQQQPTAGQKIVRRFARNAAIEIQPSNPPYSARAGSLHTSGCKSAISSAVI